jgi:hypothetical protein
MSVNIPIIYLTNFVTILSSITATAKTFGIFFTILTTHVLNFGFITDFDERIWVIDTNADTSHSHIGIN